jgi:hypothetical protein
LLNLETATNLTSTKNLTDDKTLSTTSIKARTYQAPNQVILPSDQNTRQYANLTPTTTNFNFAEPSFTSSTFSSTENNIYENAKAG